MSTRESDSVAPGQIWRANSANKFFLVMDGEPPYVLAHEVELDAEGRWVPSSDQSSNDLHAGWLTTYARPYDRVERWLTDGPTLLSIDPNRHLD